MSGYGGIVIFEGKINAMKKAACFLKNTVVAVLMVSSYTNTKAHYCLRFVVQW